MQMRLIWAALIIALWGASGTLAAQQHESADEAEAQEAAGEHAEDDGHVGVHLSSAQLERLSLRVEPAAEGSAEALITLPATIEFDADRVVRIGPRLPAKLVRVTKDLGERVAAGEPLAIMESVELGQAKARYLTARARLDTTEAAYERERTLADENIASEADMLEARAHHREAEATLTSVVEELRLYGLSPDDIGSIEPGTDAPLSRYVLASPIAGIVQERDVTPGQSVGADETPIHVVDTSRVWLMIEAYERHIPDLAVGQRVTLTTRALSERSFEGRIDWISKALDSGTRTLNVRAVVDNPNGLLRAGMFGNAAIHTGADGDGVLVPVDAVQTMDERQAVFVPGEEDGAFRPAFVTLGNEAGGMVEIVAGLEAGADVVTAGAFDLKSIMTSGTRNAAHSH